MRHLTTVLLVFLCAAALAQPAAAQGDQSKCAQDWKKFEESGACFARYRIVGGGLKEDASKHCVEVPQPTCPNPKQPSSGR